MAKKKIIGVYLIKNNKTLRVRVGSTKDIQKRFSNYLAKLRGGTANKLMQQDYNEWGEQSFEFIILKEYKVSELFKREKYYQELYADCASYNVNKIKNTDKKIRRGKEARNYKEKRSKITSGESNGHNTVLTSREASEILWLKENTNMKQKEIAQIYKCSPNLVSRIGKDRWLSVTSTKPIWYIGKETNTSVNVAIPSYENAIAQ